jgi:hypothetical protein
MIQHIEEGQQSGTQRLAPANEWVASDLPGVLKFRFT